MYLFCSFGKKIFLRRLGAPGIAIRVALYQMLEDDHKDATFGGQTSLAGNG
jgi:hypothetical protein